MLCARARLLKRNVAASAVRKAVSSSALMNASGVPVDERSVRQPFGVVVCEEADDGLIEAAGFWLLLVLPAQLLVEAAEEEREAFLSEEEVRLTILQPVVEPVRAGMKRVVWFALLSTVRIGWFDEQQPESCVPVEYSWRASARFS